MSSSADSAAPAAWVPAAAGRALPVLVDCDRCVVRGPGCGDCVVAVLLGPPPEPVDDHRASAERVMSLDGDDRRALAALASAGLVPPLRLVPEGRS